MKGETTITPGLRRRLVKVLGAGSPKLRAVELTAAVLSAESADSAARALFALLDLIGGEGERPKRLALTLSAQAAAFYHFDNSLEALTVLRGLMEAGAKPARPE